MAVEKPNERAELLLSYGERQRRNEREALRARARVAAIKARLARRTTP